MYIHIVHEKDLDSPSEDFVLEDILVLKKETQRHTQYSIKLKEEESSITQLFSIQVLLFCIKCS